MSYGYIARVNFKDIDLEHYARMCRLDRELYLAEVRIWALFPAKTFDNRNYGMRELSGRPITADVQAAGTKEFNPPAP